MNAILRLFVVVFLGMAAWPGASVAEDTDLFMLAPPDTNPANPNVLIVLDNSANWSATLATGTKFDAEIAALNTVFGGLNDQFNVGLMLFGETGGGNQSPVTSYIRYAIRTMDPTNRSKLQSLTTGLNQNTDKGSNAPYGLGLFEVFKYFGGGTGSPQDATHYGKTAFGGFGQKKRDYNGNANNAITQFLAGNAFVDATSNQYVSPIGDGCAKNYVIYLSNGLPQAGADNPGGGNPNASQLLANVGGNTATIPLSNNTAQGNIGDEYARFLSGTDVSTLTETQKIITYTIFMYDPGSVSGNDDANIVLLRSMANQGRGKYFAAEDGASLINVLNIILREIQSVNEVFASVSLPVSVNVRGTSLNQVYMGVFRPDENSLPRWYGNLKEYQLILSGGTVYLGDTTGVRADNPTSGFITNNATSYWTAPSSFWSFSPSGSPPSASDKPDGPLVEKGAAAQRLRTAFAASQAARRLYTCTGTCPAGSLSATPFNTTTISPNSPSNQTAFGATDAGYSNSFTGASGQAGEVTDIINWVRGADNINDENLSGTYTDIRASIHGDVVHAKPAVINYNRTGTCDDADEDDVMVYYGENDGVFHALKGGKGATDGAEKWGFIPPEFYAKLKRLRDNSTPIEVFNHPPLDTSNNKSYFADGSVSIYQVDANNDCRYTTGGSGDKVHIFLSMRRGGRFIYALDVINPDDPRLLWKISNTTAGFAELGYTWSIPAISILNLNGTQTPVLVFGGGYDPDVEDVRPVQISGFNGASAATLTHSSGAVQTRTMGRRVFIVNAADGSQVWSAGGDLASSGASGVPDVQVAGMNYAMPSDAAVIDTNQDRVDDRFYIGDTAGNVWRGDIGDPDPTNWNVKQLAAIDDSNTARRKFLYAPVVVAAQEQDGTNFHAVLLGSGDREHPFNQSVTNRFYMFKDAYTGLVSGQTSPIAEPDLFDATNAPPSGTNKGWYITLAQGEKVVSNAAVLNGVTLFNTSLPPAAPAAGVCTSGLGRAYLYAVGHLDGAGTLYVNEGEQATDPDARRAEYAGGGFPPPPTPAVVEFDTDGDGDPDEQRELTISGPTVTEIPGAALGDRVRTYWYEEFE
jgi:type IV pilus assembly protein PilY1